MINLTDQEIYAARQQLKEGFASLGKLVAELQEAERRLMHYEKWLEDGQIALKNLMVGKLTPVDVEWLSAIKRGENA